ncbi:MAG: hypothetical protein AAGK09_14895, partial [Planctomycetota bacterium]
ADANRLSRGAFPSPRAHRDAVAALERYLDTDNPAADTRRGQTPATDDARRRAARLMLLTLYRDTGNTDDARRLADALGDDPDLPDAARTAVADAEPWFTAPGRRVTIPAGWSSPALPVAAPATEPADQSVSLARPTAWVIEADPALPLTRAVARALASGDYPPLALHTVYAGDPATIPAAVAPDHALHRLTADPAERQALTDMAVDRVPAVVLLNASSNVVATGHAPATLDRLLIAPGATDRAAP